MGHHGGGGLVVGGCQVVLHLGREFSVEDAEEDCPVFVLAGWQKGEELIHQVRGAFGAEGRHVQDGIDLLPLRLSVASS